MTNAEKLEFIRKNLTPPRTEVNAQCATRSSTFDPRPTFRKASINVLFPAAPRDNFSDDRSNSAADDDGETSESHRIGFASDLLNCHVAGEVDCVHGDIDHVARAVDCLTGYMKDEAARQRNLNDAAKTHSVRFAS